MDRVRDYFWLITIYISDNHLLPLFLADTEAADLSNACELAAQLIPVCSQWINKMNELASRRWSSGGADFCWWDLALMASLELNTDTHLHTHTQTPVAHWMGHFIQCRSTYKVNTTSTSFLFSICLHDVLCLRFFLHFLKLPKRYTQTHTNTIGWKFSVSSSEDGQHHQISLQVY